jgi:CheY-like chemotaxis protein
MARASRTILVVDDDADIRELLSELLAEAGYRVATATNGRDALDYLRGSSERPCVILLDLMMPELNGWQFRDAQLQDRNLADIPVVAFMAAVEQGAAVSFNDFLRKPASLDQLLEILLKYC